MKTRGKKDFVEGLERIEKFDKKFNISYGLRLELIYFIQSLFRQVLKEYKKENQIEYAIQQFTGMHGSQGRDIYAVCLAMGLLPKEWKIIKKECHWLHDYEITEIEDYISDRLKETKKDYKIPLHKDQIKLLNALKKGEKI